MKTRVITGIVLGLVFVPLFILGSWPLQIVLTALSIGATYEFFRMYNNSDNPLPKWIGVLYMVSAGLCFYVVSGYFTGTFALEWGLLLLLGLLITTSFLLVFVASFDGHRAGEMMLSILYPAIGFATISALRDDSVYVIGFVFLITIATDIFAYIVGINFGKHRLAVTISPKKSIEGSIGGTVAAILFTTVYVVLTPMESIGTISLNIGITILLVLGLSIVGQIGDLVASKLKRQMGIKDFSNLFPGHGGVMDRFDSILLVAIVTMFISLLVGLL
jgi:phosphatidate cytidylyltransferase